LQLSGLYKTTMSNFSIIGSNGFIAPRHKQAIKDLGHKVVLTCDIKGKADFKDWVEMFNHPKFKNVEYVSICTPNYLHSIITREALLKGKKVLCEKPLSVNGTEGMDGVNAVLQLRYNPAIMHLKLHPPERMHVEAKMFRGVKYFNSWKGNEVMSGGILYNLGVHYIDLLVHIFGTDWKILGVRKSKKCVTGTIRFGEKIATFHVEIVNRRKKQGRILQADGAEVILSNQENLSYEDLHKEVYKEMLEGRGIGLSEAQKALDLVKAILEYDM
jgi:UDP-N-acetyl-2-amino-2-deoxyglucuronate dehydrogenase